MIDTHCHMLPGIDDGAPDAEVALEMARIAVNDGVRTTIVTPHMREGDYMNERDDVLRATASFEALLTREGVPLEVVPGSEVHLGPRMAERIEEKRLLTYADGGRYLLLECPYRTRPVRLEETIFELTVAGVIPVIAHPERIRFFTEDDTRLEEVLRLGCIAQLTSSSLVGVFGRQTKTLSEDWVARGLVHILGSDAHDTEYRRPTLSRARAAWAALTSEEDAALATEEWPRALIEGAPIDPEPPDPPRKSRGWFSRLLGG